MSGPLKVLIVEDNPLDAELVHEFIMETGCAAEVSKVGDGKMAVEFLERASSSGERPHLVLLDLDLPKLDGHQVLEHIRAHLGNGLAVYIYSGSRSPEDLLRAEGKADGYLVKPMGGEEMDEIVRGLRAIMTSLGASGVR